MEMRLAAPVNKGYFFLSALPRLVDSASPRTISIDKKKSSGTQESEFPHLKWPRGKKGDGKLICMFIISARVTEPKGIWYPGPRGFSWFFFAKEINGQAAKRRQRVAKATKRERKTSGYLGLESHLHADDRVRIWPSGVDWLIVFQTRKPISLARLIVIPRGRWGFSHLILPLSTREENCLYAALAITFARDQGT